MRRTRQEMHDLQVTDLRRALEYQLRDNEEAGFRDMLEYLEPKSLHGGYSKALGAIRLLSDKQLDWLRHVLDKHEPTYLNLYSSGKLPPATQDIPINCGPKVLKPPGQRTG